MNKAIFIDRDGTIARDVPYCRRPEDMEFLPSVVDGLRLLDRLDFKIIVITNQSGVARGYFSEETLGKIHDKMSSEINSAGGRIDAIYYCPHHPDDKCACRKPETGLMEQAAREWDIDLSQSYFIGDKFLDMSAANKAGCKAVLVPSEAPEIGELVGKNGFKGKIDFVCPDFITAAKWIEKDAIREIKVSVIVPTLNEAENLPHVLPKIPGEVEVVIVDGASTDGTVEVAKKLRDDVRIVFQDGRGKGNAVTCGVKAAAGDYFLVLDADGSQLPEELPLYIEKAREGYDLIKGSRYMRGAMTEDETWQRKILIKIAQGFANTLWRTHYSDICYGMFMINRQKFLDLNIASNGFDIEWELMAKAGRKGLKVIEVPAVEHKRIKGESHLSAWRDGVVIAKAVFKQYISSIEEGGK